MITALETHYAGCRFRSRLEARWAVFFDQADIPWEYEPEAFALKSGGYLPDFRLPTIHGGMWFEVKRDDAPEDLRWRELAAATQRSLAVGRGFPRPDDPIHGGLEDGYIEMFFGAWEPALEPEAGVSWDCMHAFGRCPHGVVTLEFEGRAGRACRRCTDDGKYTAAHHPTLIAALNAARSARFEPGAAA